MSVMQYVIQALQELCTLQGIIFVVAGTMAGVVLGAIPGLGSSTLMVVLLPIAYKLSAPMAMALFLSIVIGGMSGGCIGSILLGIPGTASSLCTVWDGYEFTKKGDPVRALSAAVTANFFGNVPSMLIAIVACRSLANWAIKLGPWEYAALCYCAILMVVGLSKDNMIKSMIGVGLALFASSVGADPLSARGRFLFGGNLNFLQGFNLIAIMLGLFASKIIMLEYARQSKQEALDIKVGKYRVPLADFIHNKWCFVRSWFIGVIIGFLPGLGGPVAAVMAYSLENMLAKDKSMWGRGEIAGVIACETSNNASIGGALIPMIALGIPGDAACVQFIAALNVKGIDVGPMLMREHPEVVYMIFTAGIISGLITFLYQTVGMPTFPALLKIPYHYLYSMVIILALTGAYMSTGSFFGLLVAIVSCVVGVLMDLFGIPSLPFLMAYILSPMLELNLRRGFNYSTVGPKMFFTRPLSGFFIVLGTLVLIYGFTGDKIKAAIAAKKTAK